ncbi:MAG TPA: FtsX-like permease family protein [Coriobacteriia bacterium]
MNVQLTLAWRYLRGRGTRTFLTTLSVVFGVMLIFGLNGLMPAMMQVFSRTLVSTAGKVDATITSPFGASFSLDVAAKVARVPGVARVTPMLQRTVPLAPRIGVPAADQVTQAYVIGVDPATVLHVRDLPVATGRSLAIGDGDVVVLASDLAKRLGVGLGGTLSVPSSVGTTKYTVVGLLSSATAPGQEQLYVPLASAQRLFAEGQSINEVDASFTQGVDRAATEAAVQRAVGKDLQVGGLSSNSSLIGTIQVAQYSFNMFGIFALATGAFIILNSFRTVVAERRRDIGMLRAIGAKRGTVVGMFLIESLIQGMLGTAMGIAAGWAMAAAGLAALNPIMDRYFHMTVGAPVFEPWTWAFAITMGVGVTIAAAIVPAMAAGRVTPMEAMRPQLGEVYERRVGRRAWIGAGIIGLALLSFATRDSGIVSLGSVVFLVGIALVAPAIVSPVSNTFGALVDVMFVREGGIARSNLQRNPGRSAITVTAVMLGLATIIAMAGVITSIFAGFTSYITKSMSADFMLLPQSIVLSSGNVAAGPRLTDEVRHTAGMGTVTTLRLGQGKIAGAQVQALGIDPATYAKVASFEWSAGSSDAAIARLSQGRWLIANGIFASSHKLTVGQAVTFETPNGPKTYHVAGIGNDYLNAKLSTTYVSQDNLAKDFNVVNDLVIMGNLAPGADKAATQARLESIVAGYPAFKLYESSSWLKEQLNTFDQTMGIFYVLGAALALPSLLALVNTLAISVLGRTREIGMLRAVGSTRRQVRRMVMAESLLLSAIGTALGIVSGVWLGYALVEATVSVGWPMPYFFPWAGILLTIAVGLGFGVLAAYVPARNAARLNVVDALHFE